MLKLFKLPDQTPVGPEERVFVSCSCQGHAIEVSKWDDDADSEILITYWDLGNLRTGGWRGFRQKLRDTWRLWRYGNVYIESVILDRATARAFGEEVVRIAQERQERDE